MNPKYSLERLMLKLKLRYFVHLMRKADSLEYTLILEKIEGKRRRGHQRMRWLNSITISVDMNLSILQEIVEDRGVGHTDVHLVVKSWIQLSNWTTTKLYRPKICGKNQRFHGLCSMGPQLNKPREFLQPAYC